VRLERLAVGRIDAALEGGQEGAAPVGILGADLKAEYRCTLLRL
jgi:hypothetical protein